MINLGKESETIEFKKSTAELKAAMDDICAILNKSGKGRLYIGVKPNGDAIGQQISESTLNDVARTIKEAIRPMIYPEIKETILDGNSVIEVNFQGDELLYSSYGRYYKRVFDRAEELTPDELMNIISNKDFSSRWEDALTSLGKDAIDLKAVESFYNRAITARRLEPMDKYDPYELLISLGLLKDNKLTNAGYLLFSNQDPIVLKTAIYVTDERLDFGDIERIPGNIYNLIDVGINYIKNNIHWGMDISKKDGERIILPEIPMEAISEIVVNSFAHANYRNDTEHQIVITPSLVEIYNPGDFPKNYKPEDFSNHKVTSIARNKRILDILFRSKNVEVQGSGFRRVFSVCEKYNVKTFYNITNLGFTFDFKRRSISETNIKKDETNIIASDLNPRLNKMDKEILFLLKVYPFYTREEIAIKVNKTVRTIQRSLNKLVEEKYIKRIGSKKTGYWQIMC